MQIIGMGSAELGVCIFEDLKHLVPSDAEPPNPLCPPVSGCRLSYGKDLDEATRP